MTGIPKEYYLQYAGKTPEQDILADTMSLPFQQVRVFPENTHIKEDGWHNMLIFGDNLQALKHLIKLKKEGKLRNPDGSDGVKLCYIDPPFATLRDFSGTENQKAYADKIMGSEFIEFLRKRLILIKELLSDDGTIYIHLDQKRAHYVKLILDEVFGENNFLNEIVWHYTGGGRSKNYFSGKHDNIFWYRKGKDHIFNINEVRVPYKETSGYAKGGIVSAAGKKYEPNPLGTPVDDVWDIPIINPLAEERIDYPTQKPETLIERIIKVSSNEGDLVLDCFAGSGTTGAVAEKIKDENGKAAPRRWVLCDIGKLAIYTITKRMLDLKEDIGNRGKILKPKPFILYNAGLYDYNLVEKMGENDYRKFCLELFQCVQDRQEINGFETDGIRDNAPVLVFKGKYLTHDFIKSLHKTVGEHLPKKMFIIAPDASVKFFEDWVEEGGIKYYVLRIPYSIIDEIEKQEFTPLRQPDSISLLNDIVESVGFDFIEPPEVEAEYSITKPKNKLAEFAQINIRKFKSNQRSKKEKKVPDEEALSMVLIDSDYDGKNFRLTDKFFKDELEESLVRFDPDMGKKAAAIYIDIYGNEKFEVIEKSKFRRK